MGAKTRAGGGGFQPTGARGVREPGIASAEARCGDGDNGRSEDEDAVGKYVIIEGRGVAGCIAVPAGG